MFADRSQNATRSVLIVGTILLLAVAVFLRAWKIDHIPGINGDEAWMAVQAQEFLVGGDVTWQTPTGNPLNPFLFLPHLLLAKLLPPSVVALRLPTLLSGLAALCVNYWLCRRVFDRRTALITTATLAVLPINIAYSRFAWDASQSLLFTLPVVYGSAALATTRRPTRGMILTTIALAATIVVHPTNIFIAPLLLLAIAWAFREQFADFARKVPISPWHGAAVAFLTAGTATTLWLYRAWFVVPLARMITPGEFAAYLAGINDLFSGRTAYLFLSGSAASWSPSDVILLRLILWGIAALAAVGMLRYWQRDRHVTEMVLLVATLISLCGFFLIAGSNALRPGFERYGIWMIAPCVLLITRGLLALMEHLPTRYASAAGMLSLTLAAGTLGTFHLGYTQHFELTGGESHRTFRTASVEPKLAALETIQRLSPAKGPIRIVTHEWWSYWPLRYFSFDDPRVQVVTLPRHVSTGHPSTGQGIASPKLLPLSTDYSWSFLASEGRLWLVEFSHHRASHSTERLLEVGAIGTERHTISAFDQATLLNLYQVQTLRTPSHTNSSFVMPFRNASADLEQK